MYRLVSALVVCLAACSPGSEWDELAQALPQATLAVPPDVDATVLLPGHAASLTAAAAPGARVFFVQGSGLGPGVCPAPLGGTCFDVLDAQLLGSGVASPDGKAVLVIDIENSAPVGEVVAFQAVVVGNALGTVGIPMETEISAPGDVCNRTGMTVWPDDDANIECEMLIETNAVRATGYDCGSATPHAPTHPLTMEVDLRYAARMHAEWMRTVGTFGHASPGGPIGDTLRDRVDASGYRWRKIGENVARGRHQAINTLDAWLNSPGHCRTLMNPDFVDVGYARSRGQGKVYWAGDYGKPRK